MSEQTAETKAASKSAGKLPGLFAFKVGMTQFVSEKGEVVPCTVLKYEPWVVSQIKTKTVDGYEAVQIACRPRKESRSPKSQTNHLKKSNMKGGAYFVREVRVTPPAGLEVGSEISISSLVKGDVVKASSRSKGKGFAGSVKRWNAGGGPGAHGSTFHRQPGSSGNRTWPGRIMKGKHFPGHLGDEVCTVKNLQVLDVYEDDNLILLSGPVPGCANTLVKITKQS